VWFVKMGQETSGWFVVHMEKWVKNRFVMAHDKTNGQWELRNLIRHDELKDMGRLVPHDEGGLLRTHTPLSKNYLLLQGNLRSRKPTTQD
jgi:hypothetical protein